MGVHQKLHDMQRNTDWDRLQEEARVANDLQRDHPEMTRTEALKAAYRAFTTPQLRRNHEC